MDPFDDPDWLFDVKYDGFRGLCYIEPGRNRLVSRHGNTFDRFDALADQIAAALDVHDVILDGEIIAADETGRPVFIDLLRGTRALAYVAFDLLWLGLGMSTCGNCRYTSGGSGPLLQEIQAQHPLNPDRWPAIARLRIEWLDQRAQRRPRHNALHLGKKCSPPRRFGVALKPHSRQRQLLHPPTQCSNPLRNIIPRSLPLAYAEVP